MDAGGDNCGPFSGGARRAACQAAYRAHQPLAGRCISRGEMGEIRGNAGGWARVKSGFIFPRLKKISGAVSICMRAVRLTLENKCSSMATGRRLPHPS
jgi:hypothetical protein